MTLSTEPLDVLQAGLEAIAYRLALIWDLLAATVPDAREIVASGGALRGSPAWVQILADVFGHDVILSDEEEASSRGAALVALEVLGAGRADAAPVSSGTVFRPDAERTARYRDARARHRDVEQALAPLQALFGP